MPLSRSSGTLPTELAQPISTGGTPGAPNVGTPANPGTPAIIRTDPRQEYVSASSLQWYTDYARSLPQYIDDVTADFGIDLYERMLFNWQVNASLSGMKASILETGLNLRPALEDATEDGYDLAVEITDQLNRWLDELPISLDDVLWDMLNAMAVGNRVAEITYADDHLPTGKPCLRLASIKVKPTRSLTFVTDAHNNTLGLLALVPGIGYSIQVGTLLTSPGNVPNLLPREKFAVLTWKTRDGDPRGTSILRPAYDPWWRLQQTLPEYLKFLAQFAGPGLIGFTAPDAQSLEPTDDMGNPIAGALLTPEQVMVTKLQNWRNGAVAAFPNGASVQAIANVTRGGDAFVQSIAACERQINMAITTQSLANSEGQHQARAAAEVHQDAYDTLVAQAKRSVIRVVRRDILRNCVKYTWGEAASDKLTPIAMLGEVEKHDFASSATAMAALMNSGYLHYSQMPQTDEYLGLAIRDYDAAPPVDLTPQPLAPPIVAAAEVKGTQVDQNAPQEQQPGTPPTNESKPQQQGKKPPTREKVAA